MLKKSDIDQSALEPVAQALSELGYFATKLELQKAIAGIKDNPNGSQEYFSITRAVRGVLARQGKPLNTKSQAEDIEYAAKTLTTGSIPGSYLVPTIQADKIIEILGKGGVLRSSGATIWPMENIEKLRVPVETSEPAVEYIEQNAAQDASDPGLAQLALNNVTRRALVALPNELLRVSTPAVDAIVSRLLAKAFAKHEDLAFFGASSLSGGPTCLLDAAGVTEVHQNGSVLAYEDLLEVLAAGAEAEADGPFAWFMSPRSFFQRVLNMQDEHNRPIVQPLAAENGVQFKLFGEPVYITPRIPNTLGTSPAGESYICRANPSYFHVGSGNFELAFSDQFAFNKNQTMIRGVQSHSFGFAPASAIVTLMGVN